MFSNRQGNSSEEVALLSALFDVLDQDGSGSLTFKELDCFGQALMEGSEDDAERTASQYMCAALVEFCNALQRGGSTSCTKSQFCQFEPAEFPAQHWSTMVGIINKYNLNNAYWQFHYKHPCENEDKVVRVCVWCFCCVCVFLSNKKN